jgi:CMP-N-acetylneuraminic acid synthetase
VKTAVVVTARKGKGKHWDRVCGGPLIDLPLAAVEESGLSRFIHSDDEMICDRARRFMGFSEIPRKNATENELHADTIRRCAIWLMQEKGYDEQDGLLIVLGNTASVNAGLLQRATRILYNGAGSCLSVVEMHECHPARALYVEDGGLASALTGCSSNRQDYKRTVFWDGGVWGTRMKYALLQEGPSPWIWLSKEKCSLIERSNPFAFDYHGPAELKAMQILKEESR